MPAAPMTWQRQRSDSWWAPRRLRKIAHPVLPLAAALFVIRDGNVL
jgi:hypothetical protein